MDGEEGREEFVEICARVSFAERHRGIVCYRVCHIRDLEMRGG